MIKLFYQISKNIYIGTRGSFFTENLRSIPASAEEQSHKLSI